MVLEHAVPSAAKSALSIEGAMMAGGDIIMAQDGGRVHGESETLREGLVLLQQYPYSRLQRRQKPRGKGWPSGAQSS